MRQTPQCLRGWVVAPGLGAERVEPNSMPSVRSDLEPQPHERIDHALIFVKDFQLWIGLDHRFEQFGSAAKRSGFRVDRDRDAALPHEPKHGGALEHATEVDFGAELMIEPDAHLRGNRGSMPLGTSIG